MLHYLKRQQFITLIKEYFLFDLKTVLLAESVKSLDLHTSEAYKFLKVIFTQISYLHNLLL